MIAVDTNVLVSAHRRDSQWHDAAARCVRELAESGEAWCLPSPCLHEFFAISTHPKLFAPPSSVEEALAQIDAWLASPTVVVASESKQHWQTLATLLRTSRLTGPAAHDARVAAICLDHGVRTLYTADRDFSRFPALRVVNPLIAAT